MAAMRRGSTTTTRPSSTASSTVRGNRVDLPAPGGAVSTMEGCWASKPFTSSTTFHTGSRSTSDIPSSDRHFLILGLILSDIQNIVTKIIPAIHIGGIITTHTQNIVGLVTTTNNQ